MRPLQLPPWLSLASLKECFLSSRQDGGYAPAEWHLFLNPWPLGQEPVNLSVNTAGNQQTAFILANAAEG